MRMKIRVHELDEASICYWQILKISLLVVLFVSVISLGFLHFDKIRFFIMGATISLINFSLLKWQLEFVSMTRNPSRIFIPVIGGYLFRFALMGLFLYFLMIEGVGALLLAGFGLLIVRIAIFIYGIVEKF